MAAPRYDCNEPHVGALMELSAAAASLSGFAKQPDHALEHVVCAMELVKRAHRRHIDTKAPSILTIEGATNDGYPIRYSWLPGQDPRELELIEVVW